MKLNQIVSITKILSDRKIPEDVERFLEDEYFSESKKTFVKYGDMDLFHFIRSNNKTLKRVWNEHGEVEDKLYKIKKIMEE
jgi:hypothetical protein